MTLAELPPELEARGITLSLRLRVDAPPGALTPTIRAALVEHKTLLVARLARECQWAELSTWRWGPAAGDPDNATAPVEVPGPGPPPTPPPPGR